MINVLEKIMVSKIKKQALKICDAIKEFFKDKVTNVELVSEMINWSPDSFEIQFEAYNFFLVCFTFEMGFGFSIKTGDLYIGLPNSQNDWNKINLNKMFSELQQELELRIPDKFLSNRGWL